MKSSFSMAEFIPYDLQRKDHIECYERVIDLYPNYPKIWCYNLVLRYKAKEKDVLDIKVKLLLSIKYLVFYPNSIIYKRNDNKK
jgi:hypothetical protein